MRKLICLIIVSFILTGCAQKSEKAERIIENGVEVIINHLIPYKIKGEPSTFRLEEELVIDTEREDLAELGIGGIDEYDIDSEGSIYFASRGQLFKFDKEGNFIQAIGRKGQGPGEFQGVHTLRITSSGEISVYDADNAKFSFFYPDILCFTYKIYLFDPCLCWINYFVFIPIDVFHLLDFIDHSSTFSLSIHPGIFLLKFKFTPINF